MYPERLIRPAMLRRTSRVKLARLGNKEVNDTNYKHDNNGSAAMIVMRENHNNHNRHRNNNCKEESYHDDSTKENLTKRIRIKATLLIAMQKSTNKENFIDMHMHACVYIHITVTIIRLIFEVGGEGYKNEKNTDSSNRASTSNDTLNCSGKRTISGKSTSGRIETVIGSASMKGVIKFTIMIC